MKRAVARYYTDKIDKSLKTTTEMREVVTGGSSEGQAEFGDIYELVSLCEKLTDNNNRKGAFFTPQGISSYIAKSIDKGEGIKIMDPSCGCGAILIACVRRLCGDLDRNPVETVSENIYGIDIDEFHVYVCRSLELGDEDKEIIRNMAMEKCRLTLWETIDEVKKDGGAWDRCTKVRAAAPLFLFRKSVRSKKQN